MTTIYRVTTGTPFGSEVRDFATSEAAEAEAASQAAGGRLLPRLTEVVLDEVETVAHRIASEVAAREARGQRPVGRDSTYNAVREAALAVLTDDQP
jgi:hypothetical protein